MKNYIAKLNDADYEHLGVKLSDVFGFKISEFNIKTESNEKLLVYGYSSGKCLVKIAFEDYKMLDYVVNPKLMLDNPQDIEVTFIDFMAECFGSDYLDQYVINNKSESVLIN